MVHRLGQFAAAAPRAARCGGAAALWLIVVAFGGSLLPGCTARREGAVVVYAALDREFSEPILSDFTKATGIPVAAKYDEESTKTVGLTNILIHEAGRPRCDVFWNNEVLNTIRLAKRGLLEAYPSPAAADYPQMYRAPDATWHGFAARARVLIVNTKLVADDELPRSIHDLADPKWKGRIGIARPIAGTTATHVAVLFAVLGEDKAKEFFRGLVRNEIQVLGGNKQVAQATSRGQIAFGLTDTDDADIEMERGGPVAMVYPDKDAEQMGTLFIPNTLAIVKSCPHPAQARQLVDYLLSPQVEDKLAKGPSAQIPLNPAVKTVPRVLFLQKVKPMTVDFAAAADQWDAAMKFIEDEFLKQ